MTKAASYIPADCHAITPYLLVSDINKFIDFLVHGLSGKVREKIARPDGTILHAQVIIADSLLMIGQPQAPWKPLPVMLYHYVPDCDATYNQALAAGATSEVEPTDMFYGDRHACVKDTAGNSWWIATHMEDMSAEEIQKRAADVLCGEGQARRLAPRYRTINAQIDCSRPKMASVSNRPNPTPLPVSATRSGCTICEICNFCSSTHALTFCSSAPAQTARSSLAIL